MINYNKIILFSFLLLFLSCAPHYHQYESLNEKPNDGFAVFCTPKIKIFQYKNSNIIDSTYFNSKRMNKEQWHLMQKKENLFFLVLK